MRRAVLPGLRLRHAYLSARPGSFLAPHVFRPLCLPFLRAFTRLNVGTGSAGPVASFAAWHRPSPGPLRSELTPAMWRLHSARGE